MRTVGVTTLVAFAGLMLAGCDPTTTSTANPPTSAAATPTNAAASETPTAAASTIACAGRTAALDGQWAAADTDFTTAAEAAPFGTVRVYYAGLDEQVGLLTLSSTPGAIAALRASIASAPAGAFEGCP